VNRIAVFVFHLPGGFAIDGGNERRFREEAVDKLGKGGLEFGE